MPMTFESKKNSDHIELYDDAHIGCIVHLTAYN